MFDWITKWSLQNRLLTVTAFVIALIVGVFAVWQVSLDVLPEFAPPMVVVQTEAPGLSPEDVETLITFRIEATVNGTPGMDVIRSKSSAGLSTVIMVFKLGTDIYTARQLVNERLQEVREKFPPGTETPIMHPITSAVSWLVKFALQSDTTPVLDLRTLCDWDIRNRILAIKGVASMVCMGPGPKQYQVLLSSPKLLQYDITVKDVVEALEETNQNVPGGFHLVSGQEYVVTGEGRITGLGDLNKTVVAERGGVPISLERVAEVRFGPEFPRGDSAYMGKPAIIGTVSKLFGADTLAVTRKVEEALADIQRTLPRGVQLHTPIFRQANFIESSIKNLRTALIEGAVVVTIVVVFFLFNVRASVITLVAMPLSLLLGILILKVFDVGINAMTLAGLAIAIGAVVDDAIIYVENIFRRLRENRQREKPLPSLLVVFQASKEIRNSVVYATWIILVVFGPIFLLSGVEGRIFTPLGLAFAASLFASLVVAVTLTPVLCSLLLIKGKAMRDAGVERESVTIRILKAGYGYLLRFSLRHPGWVIGFTTILLAISLAMFPYLGRSFLPEFHEGNFILAVTGLPGTSLKESMRLGYLITRMLRKYPEVVSVAQRVGRSELDEDAMPPNFIEFDILLSYGEKDPEELVDDIREDLGKIPGVAVNLGQFIAHRLDEVLSGIRAQIAIKIFGPDLDRLLEKGQEVERIMGGIRGVTDLQLEQQIRVPEVRIKVNRSQAGRLGLNAGDVLDTAQIAFNGETISQVIEGQKSFDLFLWFDEASRRDTQAMRGVLVDGHDGVKVPLSQVAEVVLEDRPYLINRERVQRRIVVQANVAGRDLGGVIAEAQEKIAKQVNLPPGYFVEYGGQFESQQEATRILLSYGMVAIVAIFVLLYKAFNSVRSSLLVMANLPLALIGGVAAIFLTGKIMSVPSMIGFIGVFGIAARNGIILVSRYRQLRAEGKSREEVVVEGSLERLTPVLMTAAAAALGLLPLLFGDITGKELARPMAYVMLGGLSTSTFLNMIIIPVLFMKYGWEKDEVFEQQLAMERGDMFEAIRE
ncbi:MAG: efflux RND transporter permease subunit [Deltaproteobacteria bacterium]|nr:efflux RND transporter permease subunit [Deltaproteobacteria bacterium]